MIRHDGLIYAYPSRADFAAEALAWTIRRDNGLTWQELDAAALHKLEPALGPDYRFAAYLPSGAWCGGCSCPSPRASGSSRPARWR